MFLLQFGNFFVKPFDEEINELVKLKMVLKVTSATIIFQLQSINIAQLQLFATK